MSRSEPKPRIIYKNIGEVIRANSANKPRNSARSTFGNPASGVPHKKKNSSLNRQQPKFIKPARQQGEEKVSAADTYSNCFHQIDAIYTDLEDFLCQEKEKVLTELRFNLQNQNCCPTKAMRQVEEMRQMSEYMKQISKYFTNSEECEPFNQGSESKKCRTKAMTSPTEGNDEENIKIGILSLKNSKIRANRRVQVMNTRKKTVYEQILEQREIKGKTNCTSGRKLRN